MKGVGNDVLMKARMEKWFFVGIDPGVRTGCCFYEKGHLYVPFTGSIIEVINAVRTKHLEIHAKGEHMLVIIEDARKRKTVPKGADRLQGAGSVKRDSAIWAEVCEYYQIPFYLKPPVGVLNAVTLPRFQQMTGIKYDVSKHAISAAMLVYDL